ncbi:hypothetical protein EYF80_014859 [Liparis tanakae]|uniref:Uncharacterized protein n=1 Tax=Liparis tanakae TaxID=230148 RepID=A0A4Z2IB60_9TELE|nr:hypothetical protein EYF80_014859 [Liparis tanakae]
MFLCHSCRTLSHTSVCTEQPRPFYGAVMQLREQLWSPVSPPPPARARTSANVIVVIRSSAPVCVHPAARRKSVTPSSGLRAHPHMTQGLMSW